MGTQKCARKTNYNIVCSVELNTRICAGRSPPIPPGVCASSNRRNNLPPPPPIGAAKVPFVARELKHAMQEENSQSNQSRQTRATLAGSDEERFGRAMIEGARHFIIFVGPALKCTSISKRLLYLNIGQTRHKLRACPVHFGPAAP